MMVKAKTEYTEELIKKFARFSMFRTPIQITVYILLEIIMIYVVVRILSSPVSHTEETRTATILVSAVFLVLFAQEICRLKNIRLANLGECDRIKPCKF